MQTIIEKINTSKALTNGLQVTQISNNLLKVEESIKKTFEHSLKVATLFGIANDYISDKGAKDELKSMNITGNKYEIFAEIFGLKSTQIKLYIAISKIEPEKIAEFKVSGLRQTLEELKKFAKVENDESEMNVTREGISESTKTEKAKKVTTEAKHVEAKINVGAKREEVIELIQKLMSDYSILPTELTATNVKETLAA